jgi:hypothetical protein
MGWKLLIVSKYEVPIQLIKIVSSNVDEPFLYGRDTGHLLRRLAKLGYHKTLDIEGLRITGLPELPSDLKVLKCSYTQLTSLPTLPPTLERLECAYTRLTKLPVLPSGLLTLVCHGTPLIEPLTLPYGLACLTCEFKKSIELHELPPYLGILYYTSPPSSLLRLCEGGGIRSEYPYIYHRESWRVWHELQSIRRTHERCRILKAELIQKAWDPRRVIQAGGWDGS